MSVTGSLTSTAPGAIVADGLPLNMSGRLEPDTIASPLSRRAMLAAPTRSGAVPNALLNTARTSGPPMLTRTICRSVWLLKLSGGAGAGCARGGAAAGGCGIAARATSAVAHVPTQWRPSERIEGRLPLPRRFVRRAGSGGQRHRHYDDTAQHPRVTGAPYASGT